MPIDIFGSIYVQILLFGLLAAVLLISVISLFLRPAKRTIRASLVEADTGHIIDISTAETSIGRAKACDVVISAQSVSRFHAVLAKRKAGWLIFDTNSTSGTFINGKRVEKKAILSDGCKIRFGREEYVFYSTAVTTRRQTVTDSRYTPRDANTKYKKSQKQYREVSDRDANNAGYRNPRKTKK